MSADVVREQLRRVGPRGVSGVYVALVLVFLFAPLVIMVLFSFNSSPRLSFPLAGLSYRWYDETFSDPLFVDAFQRTLLVGAGTALGAGALGLLGAIGLVRLGPRARTTILTTALIPLGFPALLYAIGLAVFYNMLGVGFSLWATLAGHIIVALPFVFLIVGAALERFRFSLLEAAYDLGASPLRAFLTITLPSILPAVLGAMLLAMAISVDEFVIAFFTAGQSKTLPLLLYGRLNLGVTPALNAVGTVLLLLTMTLAIISSWKTTTEPART